MLTWSCSMRDSPGYLIEGVARDLPGVELGEGRYFVVGGRI